MLVQTHAVPNGPGSAKDLAVDAQLVEGQTNYHKKDHTLACRENLLVFRNFHELFFKLGIATGLTRPPKEDTTRSPRWSVFVSNAVKTSPPPEKLVNFSQPLWSCPH